MSVKSKECICPDGSYICVVNVASQIKWFTAALDSNKLEYSLLSASGDFRDEGGFRVNFSSTMHSEDFDNFTSFLFVVNLALNDTFVTCEGRIISSRMIVEINNDTVLICIIGMFTHAISKIISFLLQLYRTSLSSHWAISGVGPTISCGQFPVSSVWWRMCGPLCGDCRQ